MIPLVPFYPSSYTKDLAFSSGVAVTPHTDFSYMNLGHLLQILYCVQQDSKGGESILVDGFRLARDFRHNHPDYFETLVHTPVEFRFVDCKEQQYFCRTTSILKLDRQGEVSEICFSHKNCVRNVPFDRVESFYQAYSTFFHYLKNPTYQYHYHLKPGEALLLQNSRILHGRTAFDPTSTSRHLKVASIDWDLLIGKTQFDRFKRIESR